MSGHQGPAWVAVLLTAAARFVPSSRRTAWRRQWDAEVTHYVASGERGLFAFVAGAFTHAIWLRREDGTMTGWMGDLRTSGRSLWRHPSFTILSVLTLGVGIGSCTAVFSMAEAALLRPLPLPEADRLVRVYSMNPAFGGTFSVSYPDFEDWTGRGDLFASAAFYTGTAGDLSGEGEPVRLSGVSVSDGFFETLRTEAVAGRLLGSGDQDPRSEPALVLSEDVWVRVFGGDRALVGATVRLDGSVYTVAGIAPRAAAWPLGADFWIPLRAGAIPTEILDRRSNHAWQVLARLQTGVETEAANDQVAAMARAWYSENESGRDQAIEAVVVPLRSSGGQDLGVLFVVMGVAVLLVLLIACINQSNLLLTHALTRTAELSIRSALGAARARLLAIMLGESVLLALLGGAFGLAFAAATVRAVVAASPIDLPALSDVRLDGIVLGGALVISLAASVFAGLMPAVRASRTSVADALRDGSNRSSAGLGGARLRRVLVALELALSVVLLTAAGLAIRTFQAQISADPGFRADNALVFSVRLPRDRYATRESGRQFFDEAVRRLEALPGVNGAGITSTLPIGVSGGGLFRAFLLEGVAEPPAGEDVAARWVTADASYLSALGVAPVRGRGFTADDDASGRPVILVSESFARRMSPDQDIVGRSIRSWHDENVLREVVGLVPDLQFDERAGEPGPVVFVPAAQDIRTAASFLVRTAAAPDALVPAVRRVMSDLDGDVALANLRSLEDAHRDALGGVRFITTLFAVFGALALGLAVVGVYALVSHSVSQRTHEIGIRIAMGATAPDVEGRVVGEGAVLAAIGIGAGLLVSAGLARVAVSRVAGLDWIDPATFLGVALLLGLATVLASWIPARRILRVDPVVALRRD